MQHSLALKAIAALLIITQASGFHRRCPRWKRECENYQTHHCDESEPWKSCCTPLNVTRNASESESMMTKYKSGVYHIKTGEFTSINAFCDMENDRGGWLTILRRNESTEENSFAKTVDEYMDGFGDLNGEFWIGLRTMHQMTKDGECELRVDLYNNDTNKSAYSVHYNIFKVGDFPDFKLEIGQFNSPDAKIGDSLAEFNNKSFKAYTKKSKEKDQCVHQNGKGGWWYVEDKCAIVGSVLTRRTEHLSWNTVNNHSRVQMRFQAYELKIRPRDCIAEASS